MKHLRNGTTFLAAFLILGNVGIGSGLAQSALAFSDKRVASSEVVKPKRKLPTGLLELKGFKYLVYVYVPAGLETDRKYPLLFMVPSETDTAEKQLEAMIPLAKSLECFLLVPHNVWSKDTPFENDRWLLKIKNEVIPRFPIDPSRVYAIGRNSGGHYAAYLITAYPNEFSAAALLGEAWEGSFSKLLKPRKSVGQQMPVVAAFPADQPQKKQINEKWALEYQRLGYPVQIMDVPAGQNINSDEFKSQVIQWLDQKGQAWKLIRDQKNKSFKQRFKRGIADFFAV